MGSRISPASSLADSPLPFEGGLAVIQHLLICLRIALTGLYYDGTCVLKHRYEERHGVGGGVEVFNGAPYFGTLPAP